ncbi:MAG: hypothetical protein DGJ47_001022, partial [Rickettsiaceae bacterium]
MKIKYYYHESKSSNLPYDNYRDEMKNAVELSWTSYLKNGNMNQHLDKERMKWNQKLSQSINEHFNIDGVTCLGESFARLVFKCLDRESRDQFVQHITLANDGKQSRNSCIETQEFLDNSKEREIFIDNEVSTECANYNPLSGKLGV